MTQPFMRAYTQRVIRTCHRRGVHAMGGMAAQIPIKRDAELNEQAMQKVRADKQREADDGHDGTWVAHPGLVPIAKEIFDAKLGERKNQLDRLREDVQVTAEQLVAVPEGKRTEAGLRVNVNVGLLYLEAWLGGAGCVPLYDLMEDAATAEISRAQLWQWIRHGAALDDGRKVDPELFREIVSEELVAIREQLGAERFEAGRFEQARALFEQLCLEETLRPFLTLPAYELLTRRDA